MRINPSDVNSAIQAMKDDGRVAKIIVTNPSDFEWGKSLAGEFGLTAFADAEVKSGEFLVEYNHPE